MCPKCNSNWYDGTGCNHCGFSNVIPQVKKTYIKKCKYCGNPFLVIMFYGDDMNRVIHRTTCDDCMADDQDAKDEYAREIGQIRMSPKRLQQYRNFQSWCEGTL